ncbi:putative transcription factor interactor and regulator CCHC(Zn) family [Helianthus annuus]|nr:putative transcription factor interactor and regulator CCHC(Zn) family [Helianthus annuus]KAJ0907789.1 putative transcription factor interactor and regulator CCHC(Zn) family [Helianthus annuus]
MSSNWWGYPSRLSPSWAESPTPPRIRAEQWASVTNQKQSEPKMTTDLYGNPIQAPVKPAPTTDLYGNPLPSVASQRHRSTLAPSSLDPRNCSQTETAFYAEIVKDVSNGESSGGNDSSEHNSSSDEDVSTSVEGDTTSSSSEDGSECESSREVINSDAERPTPENDSVRLRVKCADLEANMSELQGKHDALQASLFDLQDKHVSLNAKWCKLQRKHEALQEKYDVTFIHNQKLTMDLSKCTEANMFYENHEKEFKSVIENLKKDKTELTKMVSRKQTDINLYITRLEIMQKEMACVKTESEAIQLKLDNYLSSSYVLDHIIDVQKEKRDVTCIGYKKCPPLVRHNYDAMPDEEDRTFFEPSVPLDVKEFATGLGYKKDVSSDSDVSADTCVSSAELNQDPPVIIEDADSSDDESDDAIPAKSDAVIKDEDIPLENYILCDPPAKPAKTVAIGSSSAQESESVNLLYTLVGDDKIYSDKNFPIKNVNQSLISKVFENSTSKFLGKTGSHVTVTQCPPIPKAEVRKQFGNQKLPTVQKQQNHTKQKGKSPAHARKKPNQKKNKDVNFVKSKGMEKIETLENKSNLDFVKQATVLKRNDPNCSKPSTSGSQSSSSSARRSHDASEIVERRSCFECGTIGHIIRNCPYLHKLKAKVDVPREQNHAAQENGKGKQSKNKKKGRKLNFVNSRGTNKIETFENKSNTDFVKQSKILIRNSQNNYTQQTNGCDVGPSTSRSRSSSSSYYSYDTPRFVVRRSCFKCCEYGHIIKNCPYLTKGKSKGDVPHGNNYHKRSVSPKQTLVLLNNEKRNRKRNKEKKLKRF